MDQENRWVCSSRSQRLLTARWLIPFKLTSRRSLCSTQVTTKSAQVLSKWSPQKCVNSTFWSQLLSTEVQPASPRKSLILSSRARSRCSIKRSWWSILLSMTWCHNIEFCLTKKKQNFSKSTELRNSSFLKFKLRIRLPDTLDWERAKSWKSFEFQKQRADMSPTDWHSEEKFQKSF